MLRTSNVSNVSNVSVFNKNDINSTNIEEELTNNEAQVETDISILEILFKNKYVSPALSVLCTSGIVIIIGLILNVFSYNVGFLACLTLFKNDIASIIIMGSILGLAASILAFLGITSIKTDILYADQAVNYAQYAADYADQAVKSAVIALTSSCQYPNSLQNAADNAKNAADDAKKAADSADQVGFFYKKFILNKRIREQIAASISQIKESLNKLATINLANDTKGNIIHSLNETIEILEAIIANN